MQNRFFLLPLLSTTAVKPLMFDGGPIKAFYSSEDDVPDTYKDLYVQRGERWELNVEIPGVEGAKSYTDFDRLGGALRKERNDHKTIKESLKKLTGNRSAEDILADLDRIPDLEAQAAAAGDPKQIDTLVEARIKTRLAPVERERDQLKGRVGELEGEIGTFRTEKRTRAISDSVREAAIKVKLLPEAVEDAIIFAERVFEVADDGKVVAKDNVGVTPGVDPYVWFTDMQSRKPHWFGQTSGGGASGSRNGGGGAKNPWSAADWNMTEQGQILKDNPTRAEQLARSAGTTIGGKRPEKK